MPATDKHLPSKPRDVQFLSSTNIAWKETRGTTTFSVCAYFLGGEWQFTDQEPGEVCAQRIQGNRCYAEYLVRLDDILRQKDSV